MDAQPSSKKPMDAPVTYVCGGCAQESTIKQALKSTGDSLQCPECGFRVLYKKRTRRIVQHEAR